MIQRIQGLASLSSPEKEFGTGSSVGSKIQEFKDSKIQKFKRFQAA